MSVSRAPWANRTPFEKGGIDDMRTHAWRVAARMAHGLRERCILQPRVDDCHHVTVAVLVKKKDIRDMRRNRQSRPSNIADA